MVKNKSPKSGDNTNIKDIQTQLSKIQDDFKSNKKQIIKLEKDNKELVTTITTISKWKNKFENSDNIHTVSSKEDLNKNLPFFLLDIMKNINTLNDFNLSLLNEIKNKNKRAFSDSDDYNSDTDDLYNELDDNIDDREDDSMTLSTSDISQEELDDINENKKSIFKSDKITTSKKTDSISYPLANIKNKFYKYFKHHNLLEEIQKLDKNHCLIIHNYLTLFYKNNTLSTLSKSDISYFIHLNIDDKLNILNTETNINNLIDNSVPPRYKIMNSKLPIEIKNKCIQKLIIFENSDPSSSEYNKLSDWINGIISIPWNQYKDLPINLNNNSPNEIYNYLNHCIKLLDNCIYGQNKTKQHIIQLVSKMITNPNSIGNVFSIYGPMGTGKTTIIKEGMSKLLNLPFIFISLGGASDSSLLDGHSYTYEGAIPGRIIEALKTTKCMNPIFYFDELDKVSDTNRGLEIINLLIHLTDPSQNNQFQDKYYGDIPFDLSKALFVFSFNDINKINPILRDRMNLIKVDGFTDEDKMIITKDYLLPTIMKEYSITNTELIFNDSIIKYIINKNKDGLPTHNKEEGVRNIKRRFEIIISNINVIKIAFMKHNKNNDIDNITNSKKRRKITNKSIEKPNKKHDTSQYIDIELIKNILPHIKYKLKNKLSINLENTLKNIKIPINITVELVDLFIDNNSKNDIPMQMYT